MDKALIFKLALIFAAIGLLDSAYLTYIHYTNNQAACPEFGAINCENVLTSPYAVLIGLPVALLGAIYFLAELAVVWATKSGMLKNSEPFLVLSGLGVAFAIYFIYAEYLVGSICLYCTLNHICIFALFLLSIKADSKK